MFWCSCRVLRRIAEALNNGPPDKRPGLPDSQSWGIGVHLLHASPNYFPDSCSSGCRPNTSFSPRPATCCQRPCSVAVTLSIASIIAPVVIEHVVSCRYLITGTFLRLQIDRPEPVQLLASAVPTGSHRHYLPFHPSSTSSYYRYRYYKVKNFGDTACWYVNILFATF